jgi:hypothetical protein
MVHEESIAMLFSCIGGMASDDEKPKHLQKNLPHMKFPGVKLGVP